MILMDLKAFFKPTKGKVTLLVIFLIVAYLIYSVTTFLNERPPMPYEDDGEDIGYYTIMILGTLLFVIPVLPALLVESLFSESQIITSHVGPFIYFLFVLLWNYLLVCVVNFIYSTYQTMKIK